MNRTKILGLAAALLISGAAYASASQKIVTFDSSFKAADRIVGIERMGGRVTKDLRIIEAVVAVFADNVTDADIKSLKGVTGVEEDLYLKWIEETPAALPLSYVTDGLSSIKNEGVETQESLQIPAKPALTPEETEIPWGVKRVNAPGVWNTTMGEGVKVAVIDTGIDYNHPDLKAVYAGGYNAIVSTKTPLDDQGHGTHVSGTIAAVRDAKGVVGIAPRVQLYAVKVLDANGSGSYSNIVDGIQWAVNNKMQVINMSLGGGSGTPALQKVMEAADKAGVTIVCAAGNDSGPVNYPAKYPQAIAVSASDSMDKLAYFSSRGAEIAFIAPGVDVPSTYKGSAYKTASGTSMASPHVAGLAVIAVAGGANTPAKVRAALNKAASSLGMKPTEEGAGMIDAAKLAGK
ncbi:MAG: S8 family peptidase [Elusimicrobiota bacterium]